MKPLMIACSADINPEIQKEAIEAGFDIVVQAPLTDKFLKEVVLEVKKIENEKKTLKKIAQDVKGWWKS